MMTHIRYPEHNSGSKVKFKKKSRWWPLPLKKIAKRDVLAIDSLILIKFAATMHINHCNFNSRSDQLDSTLSIRFLQFFIPKQRKKRK